MLCLSSWASLSVLGHWGGLASGGRQEEGLDVFISVFCVRPLLAVTTLLAPKLVTVIVFGAEEKGDTRDTSG